MAFRDAMDRVAGAVTRHLGEGDISYVRGRGSAITIRAVFQDSHLEVDPTTGGVISVQQPEMLIRNADLPFAPRAGDAVAVRGTTYRVVDVQPDGNAATLLRLNR